MANTFENRKGFTFYRSYWEVISDLSDEQAGELIKGIAKYQFTGEKPKFKGVLNAVWKGFETLVDGQVSGYLNGVKTDNSNKRSNIPPNRGAKRGTERGGNSDPNRPLNDKEQRTKSKEESSTIPTEQDFIEWVKNIGKTEKFGKKMYQVMKASNFTNAKGEPIGNWKRYCSTMLSNDDWKWGDVDDEIKEQLYKDALWLSQSRGRSFLQEETARTQLEMGRLNSEMLNRTKRYLHNKEKYKLDDNDISEFLRNKGR